MSKVKKRWITFISLISALFLVLGLVIGLPRVSAFANTYAPGNIFRASGSGGQVGVTEHEEGETGYVQFTIADGGNVYFRRDLALKWYAEEETADGKKDVMVNYLSMQFAFKDVVFEEFSIIFESAEENISKDGKTTNKIVFKPVSQKSDDKTPEGEEDGNSEEELSGADVDDATQESTLLYVYINPEDKNTEDEAKETPATVDAAKDIFISLDEEGCEIGEFNVWVKNVEPKEEGNNDDETQGAALNDGAMLAGQFTNIGGYYLDYRSTLSSSANTPITYTAKLPATADASARQLVVMKSLNKQSMEVNSTGYVVDNAPAVLVVNEEIYAFKLGQKFSLSYEVMDVCDDSVTVDERRYYMLKMVDGVPYMPNEKDMKDTDTVQYSQFNYKTLTTYTYFLPSQENPNE